MLLNDLYIPYIRKFLQLLETVESVFKKHEISRFEVMPKKHKNEKVGAFPNLQISGAYPLSETGHQAKSVIFP